MIWSYPEREGGRVQERVSYVSLKWKYFEPTNILPFWGTSISLHSKTTQSSKAENVENHNFIAQRNKLFWHWLWIATTLVRSTGTGYILCWCNRGGNCLSIDNVLNRIIFIHICVYTQEVIVHLWEIFKFLNGIYVENVPNSLCVNFRELMPRLWNNLLIWKHMRSARCEAKVKRGAQQNSAEKRKFSNHFFSYVPSIKT